MTIKLSRLFTKIFYGRDDTAFTTIIWENKDRWPYSWLKLLIEFFDPDHFDIFTQK